MTGQGSELIAFFIQVLAVTVRMGTLWMVFPFFSSQNIPVPVKLAGTLAFSVALVPIVGPSLPLWLQSSAPAVADMFFFVIKELIIGLGMGLVARFFFLSCLASAEWVGTQMGFTVAAMFNPSTQTNESPWGSFHNFLALMVFISIGGHAWCLQALIESYSLNTDFVLTNFSKNLNIAGFWIEIGKDFFFWMLKLSGPMVAVVLLLQLGMGVLSKFVPQINLWTVSIPATLGIGVFVFTLFSPMYGDVLGSLFGNARESLYLWVKVVGAR